MAPKVLIVLSSHNKLGSTGKATGWYLPEFAHVYDVLAPHVDIIVASPAGGEAPLDQASVELFSSDVSSQAFLKAQPTLWKNTKKLSSFIGKAQDFDAIYFVGGHGPMWDLATDKSSHEIVREFYESNKLIAAVCHGQAALAKVKLSNGTYLIKDHSITGFSNREEDQIGLSPVMPFMLETELDMNSGSNFEKAPDPFSPHVAVARGGKLITGQNPASAKSVGEAILKEILAT